MILAGILQFINLRTTLVFRVTNVLGTEVQ